MEPTQKQMDFIYVIEDVIGKRFNGDTKYEASKWIEQNMDEFKREQRKQDELDAIAMEAEHDDFGNRD